MTVRFDEALDEARTIAADIAATGLDVLIVRDIVGRIRLVLRFAPEMSQRGEIIKAAASRVASRLGPYAATDAVLDAGDLADASSLFESQDRVVVSPRAGPSGQIDVLERSVVGAEWVRTADLRVPEQRPTQLVAYSFKGGVGRTTAAAWLAHKLAAAGRCVLLVDLDLDSPGISALVQAPEDLPDYGVIDFMMEDAVDNAQDVVCVSKSDNLTPSGNGEVWIAPVVGRPREGYTYLPKLNRCYGTVPAHESTGSGFLPLANRLKRTVDACRQQVTDRSRPPDVVILDTRAGLHEIAAIAITELADLTLLFAGASPGTWEGYGSLFLEWSKRPELARNIRERIKVVAAMTPDVGRDDYLRELRDRAAANFELLYDDLPAGVVDGFNPAPDDETAPHYPVPVYWDPSLRGLDQSRLREALSSPLLDAAFEPLVQAVEKILAS